MERAGARQKIVFNGVFVPSSPRLPERLYSNVETALCSLAEALDDLLSGRRGLSSGQARGCEVAATSCSFCACAFTDYRGALHLCPIVQPRSSIPSPAIRAVVSVLQSVPSMADDGEGGSLRKRLKGKPVEFNRVSTRE